MNKGTLRENIIEVVDRNWPTHVKEIVRALGFETDNLNIKKVSYHLNELKKQERVQMKRIGKALVVWPHEMEKLRIIHELLREA
jgi:predicted transcriptional regulator